MGRDDQRALVINRHAREGLLDRWTDVECAHPREALLSRELTSGLHELKVERALMCNPRDLKVHMSPADEDETECRWNDLDEQFDGTTAVVPFSNGEGLVHHLVPLLCDAHP